MLVAFVGSRREAAALDFLEVMACILASEGNPSVVDLQPGPKILGNAKLERDQRHRVALLLKDPRQAAQKGIRRFSPL
jgi:hypothetical protein